MTSPRNCGFFGDTLWLQWTGGFGALLMLFASGLMLGWSSPYLALLTSAESPLPITTDEASWVASLVNFGRLFGAVIGAVSVQYLGGKWSLVLNGIPLIVCWICVILADSVVWLFVARFCCGVSIGMAFASFPLFLGEISSPKLRGSLVTLATTGMPIGIVAGNLIGAYISMVLFAYISLVPNILYVLLFAWMPESPHHLVRKKRIDAAKRSISRYDPKVDADLVVESLREFVNANDKLTFVDRLREFNLPRNRKAGLIIVVLYTFMQTCGINSTSFYMEIILTQAKITVLSPSTMVIIVSSISIPAGWLAVTLADRIGRKVLMVISCAGNALAMIGLGVHFLLLNSSGDELNLDTLQWLPIVCLAVYQACAYFGICPVPSMVLSELFAPNIKSIAACFATIVSGVAAFGSTKTFQPLVDAFGMSSVFWIQAGIMVIAVVFTITCQPETKGKSLQEIQDKLTRKR